MLILIARPFNWLSVAVLDTFYATLDQAYLTRIFQSAKRFGRRLSGVHTKHKLQSRKSWMWVTSMLEFVLFNDLILYRLFQARCPLPLTCGHLLWLYVLDYYFSSLSSLSLHCTTSLLDALRTVHLLSITRLTLVATVLLTRASAPADVPPLCIVHACISSPLPYVPLHLLCTPPNPLTCVVPRPLYAFS